jgi:hypothetical protein
MTEKLYEIFNSLYMSEDFDEMGYIWEKRLEEVGIYVYSWDTDMPDIMYKDMKQIIAEGDSVLIDDPQADHEQSECFVCLSIPRELAKKIVVLGYVPLVSTV